MKAEALTRNEFRADREEGSDRRDKQKTKRESQEDDTSEMAIGVIAQSPRIVGGCQRGPWPR